MDPVTERPGSEVRAAQLSGSHIGRTATLGFGNDRHPGGLIRGRLAMVRHGVDGDDVEIGSWSVGNGSRSTCPGTR